MNYLIRELRADEPKPYDLLLLGDEYRALIEKYLPDSQMYVLEIEQKVVGVGVLKVDEKTGEIMNIAVAPEYQRKGLGRALLRALTEAAEQQSVQRLRIATGNSGIGQIALLSAGGIRSDGYRPGLFSAYLSRADLGKWYSVQTPVDF